MVETNNFLWEELFISERKIVFLVFLAAQYFQAESNYSLIEK